MISRSRAGVSDSGRSREVRALVQSGMFGPRDTHNGVDERAPVVTLGGEDLFSLRGQPVEAAAAFAGPSTQRPAIQPRSSSR